MISSGRVRATSRVSSSSVLRQSDSKMTTRRRARACASCSRAAVSASDNRVTPCPRSRSSRSATTAGTISLAKGRMRSTDAAKDRTACSRGARSAHAAATVAAAASLAPLIEPDRSTTTAKAVCARAQCTVVRSSSATGRASARAAKTPSIEASMSRSPSAAPRTGRSREIPLIETRPALARSSTMAEPSRSAAARRRLIVSSGTRLSSSTYSRPPSRMARTSGPSEKLCGRYPCSSTRAGSNDPIRRAGVSSALPSTRTNSVCLDRATCRSKVDLPVPGGPSSRMWAPDASAARTSSSSPGGPPPVSTSGRCSKAEAPASVLVDDDAADVLAREQVLVALVDLVQGVGPGDDLVELEVARLVQPEDLRDVGGGVAVAEQAALHALAEQGQDGARQLDGLLHQLVQPGHHDHAALADRVEPGADDFGRHEVDGEDGRVGALPAGHLGDCFLRLLGGSERVGRAELHRLLALVLHRVDGDDVLRAGVASALHRVDADAADAVDRDRVAGRDVRGVHRGSPSGRHPAADEHGLVQGQVVVDLDGGGLADHAVLAEGPDHAHRAVLATGPGNREALAGEVTLQDGGAHVADGLPAGGTVAAHAAVRDEGTHHVIARSGAGDARPDLLDDPAPSCPSTIGSRASRSPWAMWTSEWHRPAWCSGSEPHPPAARRGRAPRPRCACPARRRQRPWSSLTLLRMWVQSSGCPEPSAVKCLDSGLGPRPRHIWSPQVARLLSLARSADRVLAAAPKVPAGSA